MSMTCYEQDTNAALVAKSIAKSLKTTAAVPVKIGNGNNRKLRVDAVQPFIQALFGIGGQEKSHSLPPATDSTPLPTLKHTPWSRSAFS